MNKLAKYILYKLFDLIYIIALVTLLMNNILNLPLIDAHTSHVNVTKLAKVAPPESSSISDRIGTIFATSPTGISPRIFHGGYNINCTLIDENQLHAEKRQDSGPLDIDSDYSSSEDINEEEDDVHKYRAITGCQTCNQSHEELIEAKLRSIHDIVLFRLGWSKPPTINVTNLPKVPPQIIDEFLKQQKLHQRHGGYSSEFFDEDMQSDDPNVLNKYNDNFPKEVYEEVDDDFFPITERMYVFPKNPKLRHQNRKTGHQDLLQFHFNKVKNSQIAKATLHLFIHSEHWLAEHDSHNKYEKLFNITVHRVKRQVTSSAFHHILVNHYEGHIPKSKGHYISIDVTKMVDEWYRNPSSNYGAVIKVNGQNGHKLIVTNMGDRDHTPYIEMNLEDVRKRRTKRSLSLNCRKEENEKRCCRYPLIVDFRKFAWDWIIAPNDYMANYCAGECTITFLPQYVHTHVWQLSTTATPCCSPARMSPLLLLYYDRDYTVVQTVIPNMIVETCSCS